MVRVLRSCGVIVVDGSMNWVEKPLIGSISYGMRGGGGRDYHVVFKVCGYATKG